MTPDNDPRNLEVATCRLDLEIQWLPWFSFSRQSFLKLLCLKKAFFFCGSEMYDDVDDVCLFCGVSQEVIWDFSDLEVLAQENLHCDTSSGVDPTACGCLEVHNKMQRRKPGTSSTSKSSLVPYIALPFLSFHTFCAGVVLERLH